MATVWIVNKCHHQNYSAGGKWGQLVPLTIDRVNVFALDNLVAELVSKLEFATADDYILISGYAVLNSIVIHYFVTKFGKANLLMYEGNNDKYMALTLKEFMPTGG